MRDGFDQSTLMHRISARRLQNRCEMAKLLVEHGADVNAKDATGATPLDLALRFNASEDYVAFLKSAAAAAASDPPEWRAFWDENDFEGRVGFRNGAGKVVVPARFLDADCAFFEGFAWVNTENCDAREDHPDIPYIDGLDLPARGDFIDPEGRPLLSLHAHTVHEFTLGLSPSWQVYPRFNHGLAFVRLADGLVYGVTTNGTTLPCHETLGSFAPLRGWGCVENPYWFYRGDWALVGLRDGRAGILGPDHGFAVGPSEDVAEVETLWKEGLKRLDPFDFEGADSSPWLRVGVMFDKERTMPLWEFVNLLRQRLRECFPRDPVLVRDNPPVAGVDRCTGSNYVILDFAEGSHSMVRIPAGTHDVRTLIGLAAEQTDTFPVLTRLSAVFIDLPSFSRDPNGPVVLPFRTKPSGLLADAPSRTNEPPVRSGKPEF